MIPRYEQLREGDKFTCQSQWTITKVKKDRIFVKREGSSNIVDLSRYNIELHFSNGNYHTYIPVPPSFDNIRVGDSWKNNFYKESRKCVKKNDESLIFFDGRENCESSRKFVNTHIKEGTWVDFVRCDNQFEEQQTKEINKMNTTFCAVANGECVRAKFSVNQKVFVGKMVGTQLVINCARVFAISFRQSGIFYEMLSFKGEYFEKHVHLSLAECANSFADEMMKD